MFAPPESNPTRARLAGSPRQLLLSGLLVSALALAGLTAVVSVSAQAQPPTTTDVSAREILEADKQKEKIVEEKEQSDAKAIDSLSTPLNALLGLSKALENKDAEHIDAFLDRRYLPREMEQYSSADLMMALSYAFGQQNILNLAEISDDPRGNLEDGLPAYREQIGTVVLSTGEVPIYLQRVPDDKGGKVWKLSNATVAQIPAMWEELGYSPVAEFFYEHLPDVKFMGMDNWQLLATILAFIAAWPIAALASYLLGRLALLIPNHFPDGIQRFFRVPMRFFLFILIARLMINNLGLSLTARVFLESSGMDFIAWTILLLGSMSLLRDYQIKKMQHAGNTQYVALLKPFTTILKVLAITIIALYWAESAGYDMSTILAGLGVGSLAVALAAQRTLENVIGAVTLYTARPVSAGDFCRFGKIVGTVEEIGLRSTLIRTLDRTMVAIPNSVFASQEIENFSRRDRIRYYRHFRLQFNGADQLRLILAEVRQVFLAHPAVIQDTVSIRFENVQDANAILRLDAGVRTTDYQYFLAVAEDINLRLVDIVQAAGAVFSGPGQYIQLQELEPDSPEQLLQAQKLVSEWREQGRLPFPNFSETDTAALKDTLDYPPKGSPG